MNYRPLALMMGIFFISGLTTVMNHLLIPFFQSVWDFSFKAASSVQFAFYLGYAVFSPLTGFNIRGMFVRGMRFGTFLAGLSAAMIALFSLSGIFSMTLFSIFCMGSAIAIIQVCLNPYVIETQGKSALSVAQSATGVGMLLAPLIGSRYFFSGVYGTISVSSLYFPYLMIAGVWVGLGVLLLFLSETKEISDGHHPVKPDSILLFGFLGIALSVGVETAIASYIVKYLAEPQILNRSLESAGYLSMYFWLTLILGRAAGGILLRKIEPAVLLRNHALSGFVITAVIIYAHGWVSAAAIIVLGFSISVLFPIIFASVIENSQERTSYASGILCMANIGGAIVPFTQGVFADSIGLQLSFVVPLACFLLLSHPRFRCQKAGDIESTIA